MKLAAISPLIRVSGDQSIPRGDEVQPMLTRNPYSMDPQQALDYENGYEWALSLGHMNLMQAGPDDVESWAKRPRAWVEGFATGAGRLGAGTTRDTLLERVGAETGPPKIARSMAMDVELSPAAKLASITLQCLQEEKIAFRNFNRVVGGLGGATVGALTPIVAGALTGGAIGDIGAEALLGGEGVGEVAEVAGEAAAEAPGFFDRAMTAGRHPWSRGIGQAAGGLAGSTLSPLGAMAGGASGLVGAETMNRTLFAPSPRSAKI